MKVYIETLGCPKNFNDTEVAKGCLCEERDFTLADSPEEADIIMVNTCGFINDAKKESIDKILEMSGYKESGESEKKLVVSGCLSERYSKELFDEMPEVDCFIGVNEYERLPEILRNLHSRKNLVSGCVGDTLPRMRRKLDGNPFTSTLKIAEGCNNYCAYCVIPSIRGGFRSKKMEDVLAEAEELAAAGCKELILIAQDVTNYGIDLYWEYKLPELLRQLCRIDALHWIRLMYCYEDRITDELIEVMAAEPKISKNCWILWKPRDWNALGYSLIPERKERPRVRWKIRSTKRSRRNAWTQLCDGSWTFHLRSIRPRSASTWRSW